MLCCLLEWRYVHKGVDALRASPMHHTHATQTGAASQLLQCCAYGCMGIYTHERSEVQIQQNPKSKQPDARTHTTL